MGDMFQKEIDKLFCGMPHVFGIADDILIACFNELGMGHSAAVDKVLRICRQANLKLNTNNCLFRCTCNAFFSEIISQQGVGLDYRKVQALTDMPPPKSKSKLQLILGMLNYLSKFLLAPAKVCEPLQNLHH